MLLRFRVGSGPTKPPWVSLPSAPPPLLSCFSFISPLSQLDLQPFCPRGTGQVEHGGCIWTNNARIRAHSYASNPRSMPTPPTPPSAITPSLLINHTLFSFLATAFPTHTISRSLITCMEHYSLFFLLARCNFIGIKSGSRAYLGSWNATPILKLYHQLTIIWIDLSHKPYFNEKSTIDSNVSST